jgi:choline kinase
MKIVLLLAGMGRRLGPLTEKKHKCFTLIKKEPVLAHLLRRLMQPGVSQIIPVLGYDAKMVLKLIHHVCGNKIHVTPTFNDNYDKTNNLGSLLCSRDLTEGSPFIVCNGDMVLDGNIIRDVLTEKEESIISIDDGLHKSMIDSPKVSVIDRRIYDLGRHIPIEKSGGYAIGLYKFNEQLSSVFFDVGSEMFKTNPQSGFHDPLIDLFDRYEINKCSTRGMSWMDIDVQSDIPIAEKMLEKIQIDENGLFSG